MFVIIHFYMKNYFTKFLILIKILILINKFN